MTWPRSTNITVLDTPCREYQGARNTKSYGTRSVGGKWVAVHRWVWSVVNGPIPAGMKILHRCDNPPCFRYDHLFIGTSAMNSADMSAKGRAARGERSGLAKLTEAQVREIMATTVGNGKALAHRLGVSKQLVCDIRKGRAWRHVTGLGDPRG